MDYTSVINSCLSSYLLKCNPILNLEIKICPSPWLLLEECYSKADSEGSSGGGARNSSVNGCCMRRHHQLGKHNYRDPQGQEYLGIVMFRKPARQQVRNQRSLQKNVKSELAVRPQFAICYLGIKTFLKVVISFIPILGRFYPVGIACFPRVTVENYPKQPANEETQCAMHELGIKQWSSELTVQFPWGTLSGNCDFEFSWNYLSTEMW